MNKYLLLLLMFISFFSNSNQYVNLKSNMQLINRRSLIRAIPYSIPFVITKKTNAIENKNISLDELSIKLREYEIKEYQTEICIIGLFAYIFLFKE